jgi:heat shock protein HspQ
MTQVQTARFGLGQVVRHRDDAFHGLVIDVDVRYAGPPTESGPVSPDQPFYSVLVADDDGAVIAYAAEDALEPSPDAELLSQQEARRWFTVDAQGHRAPLRQTLQ